MYRRKTEWGDSRGFGGIRGNRLVNGVLDGTKRAPWGERGKNGGKEGGIGREWGRTIGVAFPLRPGALRLEAYPAVRSRVRGTGGLIYGLFFWDA